MEVRDLYDINRNLTGETVLKGEIYPKDRKILVVAIIIENEKHELLIQRRSVLKDHLWATTGGHPKHGETSLQGIITEVFEELGLDISNDKIKLIHSDYDEKVFCDLYYVKKNIDINTLNLQEEEVESAKWASLSDIKVLVKNNMFKKTHLNMIRNYLKYSNNDFIL